jgi:hypothetical protein
MDRPHAALRTGCPAHPAALCRALAFLAGRLFGAVPVGLLTRRCAPGGRPARAAPGGVHGMIEKNRI